MQERARMCTAHRRAQNRQTQPISGWGPRDTHRLPEDTQQAGESKTQSPAMGQLHWHPGPAGQGAGGWGCQLTARFLARTLGPLADVSQMAEAVPLSLP